MSAIDRAVDLVIHVDGSSRGNPGPAGYAFVAYRPGSDEPIAEHSHYLGTTTNNVAEYEALIGALSWLLRQPAATALIRLDSELVYRQVTGAYRVRTPHIARLVARVQGLLAQRSGIKLELVARDKNRCADRLAQRVTHNARRVLHSAKTRR